MHEFAASFGRLAANHLWQSTGFAAVAVALALALRANSARARYWLWLAASVKFLIPFSVLAALGGGLGRWLTPAAAVSRVPLAIEEIVQPFATLQGAGLPAAISAPAPAMSGLLPVVLLAIWFCGLVAVLLHWWVRWRRVAAAVRSSTPMREGREVEALWRLQSSASARAATFNPEGVTDSSPRRKPWETEGACAAPAGAEDGAARGPVSGVRAGSFAPDGAGMRLAQPMARAMGYSLSPLRGWLKRLAATWRRPPGLPKPAINLVSSTARLEPGVFGIFRPVLWLPAGIADRLDRAELEAIMAHELCHVRRRDNLAAAVHMAVEALFWFHPLVWWLGARLTEERERACDEEVVRMGGEAQVYAESILKVCEFYLASPMACAAGVSGGGLKKRIEGIMTNRIFHKLNFAQKLLLAVAAIGAVAGPIAAGLFGQTAPPPQFEFEVASVKPAPRPAPFAVASGQARLRSDAARFEASSITMTGLISFAYGIEKDRISGPGWIGERYFAIAAKLPAGSTKEETPAMLQKLLADRFKLSLHRDQKVESVYELVLDTKGVKLKPSTTDVSKGGEGGRPGQLFCSACTLGQLAEFLRGPANAAAGMAAFRAARGQPEDDVVERSIDRPVVDQTGLTGVYDIDLQWVPPGGLPTGRTNPGVADFPPRDAAVKVDSIFGALEAAGLKLQGAKHAFDILVIDHVERVPSEN
jgi:uncharacterized protein (TIGR03435 family)